jgi:hypothetical protein
MHRKKDVMGEKKNFFQTNLKVERTIFSQIWKQLRPVKLEMCSKKIQ